MEKEEEGDEEEEEEGEEKRAREKEMRQIRRNGNIQSECLAETSQRKTDMVSS